MIKDMEILNSTKMKGINRGYINNFTKEMDKHLTNAWVRNKGTSITKIKDTVDDKCIIFIKFKAIECGKIETDTNNIIKRITFYDAICFDGILDIFKKDIYKIPEKYIGKKLLFSEF